MSPSYNLMSLFKLKLALSSQGWLTMSNEAGTSCYAAWAAPGT